MRRHCEPSSSISNSCWTVGAKDTDETQASKKLQEEKSDGPEKNEYLVPVWLGGVPEHTGLGFANEVAKGIHFKRAVEIWEEVKFQHWPNLNKTIPQHQTTSNK